MEVGDIVNIMKNPDGYWKGRITNVSDGTEDGFYTYSHSIASVEEIKGIAHAFVFKKQLEFRDGEYYQFKK